MRKLILALGGSSLVLAAPLATADVIGLGASVSYWDSELSGEAVNKNSSVDVENDLDLSSESNVNLTAYLEHPVPVLPNLRLNYTTVEQTGRGEIGPEGFDDIFNTEVDSKLELDQFDVTLYYEILDNWVNLDLGLTARNLDGELTVQEVSGAGFSQTKVDAVIPMGYAAARFDLPFTGVSVGGDINGVAYSGDSIYDFTAYGQYEVALLQLRAGYRQMTIDYEDDDEKLDLDLGGPFASVGVRF